jgi:SAM-dependent methyltransferase
MAMNKPRPRDGAATDRAYRDDLAYIHDAGFGTFAARSAPWLLKTFRTNRIVAGKVVDLGCGSGIWAEALVAAGYEVLGFDISAAMLALSRRRVPSGEFRQASFLSAALPSCVAVTALGEILGYLFDRRNTPARLEMLFRRVYKAIEPGGLFVFDVALPGRVPGGRTQNYRMGPDWACLHESEEDAVERILTRRITTFRKVGKLYRRDSEVHRLRLYDRAELIATLRHIGFSVRAVSAYGEMKFPPGYIGLIARKK